MATTGNRYTGYRVPNISENGGGDVYLSPSIRDNRIAGANANELEMGRQVNMPVVVDNIAIDKPAVLKNPAAIPGEGQQLRLEDPKGRHAMAGAPLNTHDHNRLHTEEEYPQPLLNGAPKLMAVKPRSEKAAKIARLGELLLGVLLFCLTVCSIGIMGWYWGSTDNMSAVPAEQHQRASRSVLASDIFLLLVSIYAIIKAANRTAWFNNANKGSHRILEALLIIGFVWQLVSRIIFLSPANGEWSFIRNVIQANDAGNTNVTNYPGVDAYVFNINYDWQYAMIFIISVFTLLMTAFSLMTISQMKPLKEVRLIPDTWLGKFLRVLSILCVIAIFVMSVIALAFEANYIRSIVNNLVQNNLYPNHFRAGRAMLAADAFLTLLSLYGMYVVFSRRKWQTRKQLITLAILMLIGGIWKFVSTVVFLSPGDNEYFYIKSMQGLYDQRDNVPMSDDLGNYAYAFYHNYNVQYAAIFITSVFVLTLFTCLLMKATENYMRREVVYPVEDKKSKTLKIIAAFLIFCIFVICIISLGFLSWLHNRARYYTDVDLLVEDGPNFWRSARTILAMDVALVLLCFIGVCIIAQKKMWLDPGSVFALAVMFAVLGLIRLIANIIFLAEDRLFVDRSNDLFNSVGGEDSNEGQYFNSFHKTYQLEWAALFIESILGFFLVLTLLIKFVQNKHHTLPPHGPKKIDVVA